MKTSTISAQRKVLTVLNAVAALIVAVYIVLITFALDQVWNPGAYGTFGISFLGASQERNTQGATIDAVDASSPAQSAGLKAGDTVRPVTSQDASLLYLLRVPGVSVRTGDLFHLLVVKAHHFVTLHAKAMPRLSLSDSFATIFLYVELIVCLLVAIVLVVLCANRLTWAFYFVVLSFFQNYTASFSILAKTWGFEGTLPTDLLLSAAIVGFLIFCIRFPADAPQGWHKAVDTAAPYLFGLLAGVLVWEHVLERDLGPVVLRQLLFDSAVGLAIAIITLATVIFVLKYLNARGAERQRTKWVVLGLVCNFVAWILFTATGVLGWMDLPGGISFTWWFALLTLLSMTLPLTVAYAIVRHRVIDVRFVLSRSMIFAAMIACIALVFIALDWLVSRTLPTSRFQVAIIAAAAGFVGFGFNAMRQRIGNVIDATFFGKWHRTQQEAESIGACVRQARSKTDCYEPLTGGLAGALGLGSAALFEKAADGGFVRVAAVGWPSGTLWHILPDAPLVIRARHLKIIGVDSMHWGEPEIPAGAGRPAVMVPIVTDKTLAAVLLLGSHRDGAALDPDELRVIRRLCGDAGLVYGQEPMIETSRTSPLRVPLGVT